MRLSELLKFEKITIQCHDNPDADAIASAFGLYCYFKSQDKDVRIIYSGRNRIQKSNLVLMLDKLNIPIEYVDPYEAGKETVKGLLLTVDCQYGAGNVTKIPAEEAAIIDHHQVEISDVPLSYIIPGMGSCSTLVWKLLGEEGYQVTDDNNLGTALYYGLLSDTNHFAEMNNPLDRDAQDQLPHNKAYITMFLNSNISMEEFEIAGVAMLRYSYNDEYHFAVIRSHPCDPNILGVISDFLLQVDKIYTCLVYNETNGGYKLSIRSCVREVNASELAAFLCAGVGSGGGHYGKAGGFISGAKLQEQFSGVHAEAFFNQRMLEYFQHYDLIYADTYEADTTSMTLYQKQNLPIGFVKAADVLPVGTPITIRSLEGDMDLKVEEDLVIIIGIKGEVYPNRWEKFSRSYSVISDTYDFEKCVVNSEYIPVIKNRMDGKNLLLTDYAKTCVSTGNVQIYAKPLEKAAKVFTAWDKEKYMAGKAGDYLAVRNDDLHDVYIVEREIFGISYARVEE
ncbi:MAG: DHH family phosphoesterase [Clostridiales bacterium]|nr:DHH family phosphoesterase [Candidatus Blautia equi]